MKTHAEVSARIKQRVEIAGRWECPACGQIVPVHCHRHPDGRWAGQVRCACGWRGTLEIALSPVEVVVASIKGGLALDNEQKACATE